MTVQCFCIHEAHTTPLNETAQTALVSDIQVLMRVKQTANTTAYDLRMCTPLTVQCDSPELHWISASEQKTPLQSVNSNHCNSLVNFRQEAGLVTEASLAQESPSAEWSALQVAY